LVLVKGELDIKHAIAAVLVGLVVSGCVAPEVLSRNATGISIKHYRSDEPTAFKIADEHCGALQKDAVRTVSATQRSKVSTFEKCR
jgi:hypothetical protein